MEKGKLFYNSYNQRIGIMFDDGTVNDGLHCGEVLYARVDGHWYSTRIEYVHSEWYLVGLCRPGEIPKGLVVSTDNPERYLQKNMTAVKTEIAARENAKVDLPINSNFRDFSLEELKAEVKEIKKEKSIGIER